MVAGKVKMSMAFHKPSSNPNPQPSTSTQNNKTSFVFNRSFGVFFPRASSQVKPDVTQLLKLVDELRHNEAHLKTQLIEQKLLRETSTILENDVVLKDKEIELLTKKVLELEVENDRLIHEREVMKETFETVLNEKQVKIAELMQLLSSQRFQGLVEVSEKSNLIKSLTLRKQETKPTSPREIPQTLSSSVIVVDHSRAARVPKPPPKRCVSESPLEEKFSLPAAVQPRKKIPVAPPPPPLPRKKATVAPPPPPPPPAKGVVTVGGRVKRIPEVVEFYHSLMRRDSRRDSCAGAAEVATANARDIVGEIENRSTHLLAIKTDVETQGDFIRFLIKEVETATYTDIEDVVSFVKWLDDELSYLVDERAVLKHFNWPEKKADALREAACEYSDLKKLETEASSFKDDSRQPCASALKKIQTLFEKLEHGVYNLSRLKESATNRLKSFSIPVEWMLDSGFVSQVKLASVKLAMKYMKRVLAELEAVDGGLEEELIVQGVRFAFRVHQFAGGFDVETMRAFEELRDKATSGQLQCQSQN